MKKVWKLGFCVLCFEQFGFIYSGLLLQLYLLRERIDLFLVLLIV
jgi:hypothetical protein